MTSNSEYCISQADVITVVDFAAKYQLDPTKASFGRTNNEPRGLGGVLDNFGPGKLIEIAVSNILSPHPNKICQIDTNIYSNSEVGERIDPDIIQVIENGSHREPNVYIEVKKIDENSRWLGISTTQLNSIKAKHKNQVYLIFGRLYFDDKNHPKGQDFTGAFLKQFIHNSNLDLGAFSTISNLKCRLEYVLAIEDLEKYGRIYGVGEYIQRLEIRKKKIFLKNGNLGKSIEFDQKFKSNDFLEISNKCSSEKILKEFKVEGEVEVYKFTQNNGEIKTIIHAIKKSFLISEYFGKYELEANTTQYFSIEPTSNERKKRDDFWIYRNALDYLIDSGKLQPTHQLINVITTKI